MIQKSAFFGDPFERYEKDPEFVKAKRINKPRFDLIKEILQRRVSLRLTQKELAELSNTHQSRISKIESGEHDIRLSTLIRIAEALQSTVEIKLVPISEYIPVSEDQQKIFKKGIESGNKCPEPLNYKIDASETKVFYMEIGR